MRLTPIVRCCSAVVVAGCLTSALAQQTVRVTSFTNSIAQVESTSVDLTTIPNRAILQKGQNTNIAKGRRVTVRYASNDPSKISTLAQSKPSNLTDEIISSSNFLQLLPGQEGTRIMIDLGAIRLLNKVETYTHIRNASNNRIRSYSIYTSLDSLVFRRVKQVADNQDTYTVDNFTPDTARYVALIVESQDRLYETIVSEIKIYALGYLSGGVFTSKVVDLGTEANIGAVRWWGFTPSGTDIRFQVRTGSSGITDATWSPWSAELANQNDLPHVYEPRRFVQYRATLNTFLLETPQLDSLEIDFDTMYVAATATASVNPRTVEILRDADISYHVVLAMDARSRGVDSIVINAPLPIVVRSASFNGVSLSYGVVAGTGRTAIGFASAITTSGTLSIGLRMTPVLLVNRLPSFLVSNGAAGNPQSNDAIRIGGSESWDLATIGIPAEIISTAIADPNPFTPNNDGKNDVTYFSFFVTNLLEMKPVRLLIFDVSGRLVRTLLDTQTSAKGFVEGDALPWNGTDESGRRLPPGLYIYQIIVDKDGLEPAIVTKTVTIAY